MQIIIKRSIISELFLKAFRISAIKHLCRIICALGYFLVKVLKLDKNISDNLLLTNTTYLLYDNRRLPLRVRHDIKNKLTLVFILLLIFYKSGEAQYLNNEKISFYSSSLIYCVLEAVTEAYSIREKHEYDPYLKLKYMQTWHKTKFFREIATVGTGITIALDSKLKPVKLLSNLFVTASMFWIIHDELINRINGWSNVPFGYTPKSSGVCDQFNGSFFDKFANPYLKIGSLLLSIFLNALLF